MARNGLLRVALATAEDLAAMRVIAFRLRSMVLAQLAVRFRVVIRTILGAWGRPVSEQGLRSGVDL